MYDKRFEKETFKKEVKHNVRLLYRRTIEEATPQQIFQAVSYAVKEVIVDNWLATQETFQKEDPKTVYYMSMEFLMGRALGNNLINLTAYKEVKEALEEMGLDMNYVEVWDGWRPASWIPLPHWAIRHMAAVSAIIMECLNRKSKTVIRWRLRTTG